MKAAPAHLCPVSPLAPLPRISANLPGTGGRIRVQVEDFEVEELPLYPASGEGEHLYLFIEKRDVPGLLLRRLVAEQLGVDQHDIGMAGLKDRRAVTRQWLSVPARPGVSAERIRDPRLRVLASARHGNKLRTGHLAGNRFVIVLRDLACPVGEALARAHAKVAVLAREGMPNFYGEQRMGHSGSTLAAGWALAAGLDGRVTVQTTDGVAHQIPLRDRALRRLAASALQSELFNRVVAARLEAGTLRRVLPGDLCRKTDSGGSFVTDDPAREQERLERGEIELTGPMWGPKMMRPAGEAADVEAAALAQMGLDEAAFQRLGALAQGTRRALQVRPGELACAADDASLRLRFALPAGSFATVLLHELCGPGGADDGPSEDADSEVACA